MRPIRSSWIISGTKKFLGFAEITIGHVARSIAAFERARSLAFERAWRRWTKMAWPFTEGVPCVARGGESHVLREISKENESSARRWSRKMLLEDDVLKVVDKKDN